MLSDFVAVGELVEAVDDVVLVFVVELPLLLLLLLLPTAMADGKLPIVVVDVVLPERVVVCDVLEDELVV